MLKRIWKWIVEYFTLGRVAPPPPHDDLDALIHMHSEPIDFDDLVARYIKTPEDRLLWEKMCKEAERALRIEIDRRITEIMNDHTYCLEEVCTYCGEKGHWRPDCRLLFRELYSQTTGFKDQK